MIASLPNDWNYQEIGDIAFIKGGKRVPKGKKLTDVKTEYPYIRVTDFTDDGTIDTTKIQYITEDIYSEIKNYTITCKDLYISIAGTIGKTGIIPKELDGANLTENAVKLVYKIQEIDNKFVYLFTLSNFFKEQAGLATKVVAMPKLAISRLSEIKIPLPPLEEQRRIVGVLDGLFGKIDKSIALLDESIASASSLMPSALNEVFEELGETWEKESIEKIAQIIDGDRGENYPKKDEFFEKEYCLFLSAKNVTKNGFAFKENQFITKEKDAILRKGRLQKYDLVLTTRGTIGNVAFFDDSVPFEIIRLNSGMVILRVFNENINHKFLYIFLNSPIFESFLNEIQNGAAQPQISIRNFKSLQIPLPPLDIQTQTVAYLDALQLKADALKKVQEKKKEELLALKASLLESAFKGAL